MKIKEIIQRVQSLYSKGVDSDDTRLASRHIYNKILTVRSRLISQEAKKKQKISAWNYQTISCIELIPVEAHECPCLPPLGCKILRSKYKIPMPLSGLSGDLIKSIHSIDRSVKIDEMSMTSAKYQKGNKYTAKKITYFVESEYIYISTPVNLKVIAMTALFEDPIAVIQFQGLCEECIDCNNCIDYLETDFPIDNDMIDTLIELSLQELVVMFSQVQEDVSNNSIDANREQGK